MKVGRGSGDAVTARGRERVLVRVDIPAVRFISLLMLLCVVGWLAVLAMREHLGYGRVGPGRFGWSVALLAAGFTRAGPRALNSGVGSRWLACSLHSDAFLGRRSLVGNGHRHR